MTLKKEQVYREYYPDNPGDPNLKVYSTLNEYTDQITALQAQVATLRNENTMLVSRVDQERDRFYEKALEWRGIYDKRDACPACGGSGVQTYGSTATWRGGSGGQAMTSDVCDKCWGSGDRHHTGSDLRKVQAALRQTVKAPDNMTELEELRKKNFRFIEALTPSRETKIAYSAEFNFNIRQINEDGDEVPWAVTVPWTTIKEIMKAIRSRAWEEKPQ
jgi:hypothetical protein